MPKKNTSKKAPFTIEELVNKDHARHTLVEKAKDINVRVTKLKSEIIEGMAAHGLKRLEHNGWFITVTAAEKVVYDEAAIVAELTPKQRRLCCAEEIDLNMLTAEERKKIREVLSPAQRRRVTTVTLDVERLAKAVTDGDVPLDVVTRHSETKQNAAYIAGSGVVSK